MEENYTKAQVQQHITNCFHSYDICEKYDGKEDLSEEQILENNRNKEHIQIMMAYDWFVKGLTKAKKEKLEKYL